MNVKSALESEFQHFALIGWYHFINLQLVGVLQTEKSSYNAFLKNKRLSHQLIWMHKHLIITIIK